ncbi:UNVERIFIED_CONTAM: hypothetical protein K2H54_055889, partial [Gekko kuhli]
IKANGVHAFQLEIKQNNDPFEDLSLCSLSASKIQSSVQMSPVESLSQNKMAKLPSATDNFNTLSNVNCMPAMPLAMYDKSEVQMRTSPNPFATRVNSTNPFPEQTKNAGNPFRIASGVTSHCSVEGHAAYPFPLLKPPASHKGNPAFYANTFQENFSLQSTSSITNNEKPKGWVTFDEEDFVLKLKPLDNPTELRNNSSMQAIHFPSSLGTEQNLFGSSDSFCNDWNRSADSLHPLPARPAPAPPIPSRTTSTKSATDPLSSLAPKILSTQDFTER